MTTEGLFQQPVNERAVRPGAGGWGEVSAVGGEDALLRDILARIADHPINQIDDLLPWQWRPAAEARASTEKAA
jgi:hypothetical protein